MSRSLNWKARSFISNKGRDRSISSSLLGTFFLERTMAECTSSLIMFYEAPGLKREVNLCGSWGAVTRIEGEGGRFHSFSNFSAAVSTR